MVQEAQCPWNICVKKETEENFVQRPAKIQTKDGRIRFISEANANGKEADTETGS
jgi:hypothetical protein